MVKKLECLLVSTEYTNVTETRTDGHCTTTQAALMHSIARQKQLAALGIFLQAAVADLEHFKKCWNKVRFIAVFVDKNTAEVQAAGVTMQLIDLNNLHSVNINQSINQSTNLLANCAQRFIPYIYLLIISPPVTYPDPKLPQTAELAAKFFVRRKSAEKNTNVM